jgi:hypothetical protein
MRSPLKDELHLEADLIECSGVLVRAGACTKTLPSKIEAYVQVGTAPSTKRAYRSDLKLFRGVGRSHSRDRLVNLAGHEMTLLVEMIVDLNVN